MRYRNEANGDWVEFKPGFSKQSMSKALAAANAPSLLAPWISKCEFTDPEGQPFSAPVDGAALMEHLTFAQWDWLSARLVEWARDDIIDPEA